MLERRAVVIAARPSLSWNGVFCLCRLSVAWAIQYWHFDSSMSSPNHFTCDCCKATFAKPIDPSKSFLAGFTCSLAGFFSIINSWFKYNEPSHDGGIVAFIQVSAGFITGACFSILGIRNLLFSALRSPYCPNCHSTNFSRPNPSDESVLNFKG